MTLPVASPLSGPYVGDGVNQTFPFSFRADQLIHLRLNIRDLDGSLTEVVTNFTSLDLGQAGGGDLTFPVVIDITGGVSTNILPIGWTLEIERIVPYDQPTAIGNAGGFFPKTHEGAFDYLAMQIQQLVGRLLSMEGALESIQDYFDNFVLPNTNPTMLMGIDVSGTANDLLIIPHHPILLYYDFASIFQPILNNTGPMTVDYGPGGIPFTRNSGNPFEADEIVGGLNYLIRCNGVSCKLLASF